MLCKIIPEKCIACGLCQLKAPEVFDYDLDGLVLFKDNQTMKEQVIPPALQESTLAAYRKCPTRAIVIDKQA